MPTFYEGYDAFIRLHGANLASYHGAEYIADVEEAIDALTNVLNHPPRKIENVKIDTLKGFAAEWWHEGTFNIDAALKGKKVHAIAPDDNGLADVILSDGAEIQIKYYKNGEASAAQQAKTLLHRYNEYAAQYRSKHDGQDPVKSLEQYVDEYNLKNNTNLGPDDSYYSGQVRLIPADQLEKARDWLERKINEESVKRPELVKQYQEALDNLNDRIESGGVESAPLDEKTAKEIAKAMKEDGYDPAEFGLATEELIKFDYIMEQAIQAGLSAALISVVLRTAPELCGFICRLIKNGEVKEEDFKRVGFAAVKGGAEGFVRGTIAAAITISCKSGLCGAALKAAQPNIIGAVTAIAMNTIQNTCLMSLGKISKHEFANRSAQDFVIVACSIGLGAVGSAIASSLFTPVFAVFGYMIGSFVGSVVGGFVYKGIYSCVIALCIESGSTFFGLVDQNYELPVEVLRSTGAKVFEYEKYQPKRFAQEKYEPKRFEYEKYKPVKINVTFLRRGVIGVGAIGYL